MKWLTELDGLITGKCRLIQTLLTLIKLEARLAGLSMYPLLLGICLVFPILITTWAAAMVMVGYGFLSWSGSLILTFLLIFLLNLTLLILLARLLKSHLKHMSFAKTRHYFNAFKDEHHVPLPQKTD